MTYGPADLYAIEFPTSSMLSNVIATLRDVAIAGVLTLLDVALVYTSEGGRCQLVGLDEISDEVGLVGVMPSAAGLIAMADVEELAREFTPGTSCLIVLMENTWARKLTVAARDDDARMVTIERFTSRLASPASRAEPLRWE